MKNDLVCQLNIDHKICVVILETMRRFKAGICLRKDAVNI
jgi:hypothetical protein